MIRCSQPRNAKAKQHFESFRPILECRPTHRGLFEVGQNEMEACFLEPPCQPAISAIVSCQRKNNVASVEKQSSIVLITFESLYDLIQWDSLWHSTSCISTLTSRTVACRCKFHAPWHLQFQLRATHWQLSISQSQHSQFVSGLHKTTCRSECSSVPCVKTLENQPEPDAESFASFHLALWTTQAIGQRFRRWPTI